MGTCNMLHIHKYTPRRDHHHVFASFLPFFCSVWFLCCSAEGKPFREGLDFDARAFRPKAGRSQSSQPRRGEAAPRFGSFFAYHRNRLPGHHDPTQSS